MLVKPLRWRFKNLKWDRCLCAKDVSVIQLTTNIFTLPFCWSYNLNINSSNCDEDSGIGHIKLFISCNHLSRVSQEGQGWKCVDVYIKNVCEEMLKVDSNRIALLANFVLCSTQKIFLWTNWHRFHCWSDNSLKRIFQPKKTHWLYLKIGAEYKH